MSHAALAPRPETDRPATGLSDGHGIAAALAGVLGDTTVLMVKTQACHWNVVGPLVHPIHELTEAQYRDHFEAIDKIAERMRALGALAPLSMAEMRAKAELAEEDRLRDARGMIEQLVADNEALVRRLRETAATAAERQDSATEDLMNARMAAHEEAVWMLRAVAAE